MLKALKDIINKDMRHRLVWYALGIWCAWIITHNKLGCLVSASLFAGNWAMIFTIRTYQYIKLQREIKKLKRTSEDLTEHINKLLDELRPHQDLRDKFCQHINQPTNEN